MKKTIIILTIFSLISIGACIYEGYLYINSLNTLYEISQTKNELIDKNATLENENIELEEQFNKQSIELLENNIECKLWEKQKELLETIKE